MHIFYKQQKLQYPEEVEEKVLKWTIWARHYILEKTVVVCTEAMIIQLVMGYA